MSDMRELYQEVILDHNKKPRNCYAMDCATRSADGHNPLCGDIVKVYLRIEDGTIEEISFQGHGCAICTASTSMMTESIKGKSVAEAKELFEVFHEMLTGVAEEQGVELGKLQVFEGVVIALKGSGTRATVTVRKVSSGQGVERIFPLNAPTIDKIQVVKHAHVRRAKLYFLRERKGKAGRMKERRVDTRAQKA